MTDDFTTAARAEAERRNPPIDRYPDDFTYPRSVLREHKRGEFEAGAEWARTHLAAQETDGERAVRELHWGDKTRFGHSCAEDGQDYPCATILALDSARAARRDEEKR